MQALTSARDDDVQVAQVYLRHHPIDDVAELRDVASGILQMPDSAAQVRALDALAHHRLSDRETLEALTRLYPVAKSGERSARDRGHPDPCGLRADRKSGAGARASGSSAQVPRWAGPDRRPHPAPAGVLTPRRQKPPFRRFSPFSAADV
jgi:hypothetical protein